MTIKNRVWIFFVYVILMTIGIPWYWPQGSHFIVAGLPAWVFVAIVVSLLASIFTAYLLLRYPWNMDVNTDE
jgi:hypothetical protein